MCRKAFTSLVTLLLTAPLLSLMGATTASAADYGYNRFTSVTYQVPVLRANPGGRGDFVVSFRNKTGAKRTFFLDVGGKSAVRKAVVGRGAKRSFRVWTGAGNKLVTLRVRYGPDLVDYSAATWMVKRGSVQPIITRRVLPTTDRARLTYCVRNTYKVDGVLNLGIARPGGGFTYRIHTPIAAGKVGCVSRRFKSGEKRAALVTMANSATHRTKHREMQVVRRP